MSSFLDKLPSGLLIIIIFGSYYTYIYELCILIIEPQTKKIIYLVVYNILFLNFVIMYFFTMFHKRWYVPEPYIFPNEFYHHLNAVRSEQLEYRLLVAFCKRRNIRVYTRTSTGGIRYCSECRLIKPDRAHHCSTCEACVLKMDHHCPWINNCVGFTNYKYFLILVLYSGVYCTFYFGTCVEYSIQFITKLDHLRQIIIIVYAFITFALGIAVWALLIYHMKLIWYNMTTVEAVHAPIFASAVMVGYDQGVRENYEEICTSNILLWFFPCNTVSGNGDEFDIVSY